VSGCTGQGDIDRTQPDKIDKSIFYDAAGQPKVWYYRDTVVEAPPESNWAFEGTQSVPGELGSTLEKIRFLITEKFLVGYRAYDYAPGTEDPFTSGPNNSDTPVLVYAITSHFDVKREYNPATGEQTNVISENTTDRPWDQRQFMRVDWTANQADPTNAFIGIGGFRSAGQPSGIWVGEADITRPDFADRPIFSNDLLDFVTMDVITPDFTACEQLYPFVDDGGPWNCGNAQVKTRHSFLAVKPSTYQPLDYPDLKQLVDQNGNPIQLIAGQLPCTADVIARSGGQYSGADCAPATVQEFSKFGFFRTVVQTYDRQTGATEASRQYWANRWNIWQDSVQRNSDGTPKVDATTGVAIPIAYKDRQVKPIVYYTNVEFPDDPAIWDQANAVVGDWNGAMKRTVVALRAIEAAGPSYIYTADKMANDAAAMTEDVVILKKNSCNLPDFTKLLTTYGDLNDLVKTATGQSADQLDTAHLKQACSVVEAATQRLADGDPKKFSWQRNGDLRYSFLHWVDRPQPSGPLGYGPSSADPQTGEIISASAYLYGAALDVYAHTAADTVDLLNNSISIDNLLSGKTITDVLNETSAARAANNAQPLTAAAQAKASAMLGGTGATSTATGLPRLLPIPAGITSSKIQTIKGTPVEQLLTDQYVMAAKVPQLQPGAVPTQAQLDQASPVSWLSDANQQARQARYQTLAMNGCVYMGEFADDAIYGLALQLKQQGLSGDALFLALRKMIFRGLADHEMGHTMGLRHNFSGSSDALNYGDMYWQLKGQPQAQQITSRMSEYQYSTVMDYGSRFNSDIQGLGKYDYAAIRFGYGQLMEVMPPGALTGGNDLANHIFTDDYSKLPTTLGSVDNLSDGGVMSYDYVTKQFQSYYQGLTSTGGSTNGIDQSVLMERPFLFCGDEYIGNLFCKQWDFGANQREIVDDVIDRYKNYYFFSAFKRGLLNWSIDNYMNRLLERYFVHFTEAFQFYYFFGNFLSGTDLGNDLFLASVDSLNALGEVLQTPEPGLHCATQLSPNVLVLPTATGPSACTTGATSMDIEPPDGKPYFIDFSSDYYYRITRSGSLYEKLAALISLTSTQAHFFRVDTFADSNNYAINYYRFFKDEMLGLLSGVIKNDPTLYGGYVTPSGVYQPTPVVDLSVWGNVNPATPPYMQPGVLRVDSPDNKTIQYYALGLSLANLDTTWDAALDVGNYMAVTVKGSNDDVTYGTNTIVHEYTHPQSGLTYRAPQFDARTGIGVQLVDELNRLTGQPGQTGTLPSEFGMFNGQPLPDWYTAKANLDALAGTSNQQAYNDAQTLFQFVDTQVALRVDTLGDLRMFRRAFGY
jgi:hypothetical protein